jgi:hypothetical protein
VPLLFEPCADATGGNGGWVRGWVEPRGVSVAVEFVGVELLLVQAAANASQSAANKTSRECGRWRDRAATNNLIVRKTPLAWAMRTFYNKGRRMKELNQ